MKIKKIHDISKKIHPDMVVWPGDPSMKAEKHLSISKGDLCNLSSVNMGVHTGTHADSPYHFIDGGSTIESLDLSRFIGFVKVFEISNPEYISEDDIKDLPIEKDDAVFFKTANSSVPEEAPFNENFIYLHESAAKFLVEKGVKTVGVDYFSVDSFHSTTHSAHKILLSNNLSIIENLYLKDVEEGKYLFSCLPLKISGADGSPVRAVLVELE